MDTETKLLLGSSAGDLSL